MTYTEDLDRREAEHTAQLFEQTNRQEWFRIVATYGIKDHEANFLAVKDYCAPLPISLDGFRFMLENPKAAKGLDYSDDSQQIIRAILRLLRENGRYTEHDLRTEETKLRLKTKEQQRARLAEVRMLQAHAAKSLPQLKAEVAAARKDYHRYVGFPDLPMEIVPRGKVRAVRCDAKYLKSLDPDTLREMCRRYSLPQINDAIRERV